jgi:hypothetical protein
MAETVEEDTGKVAGSAPKPDAFETTLRDKADGFYIGWRLEFITGGLVRFSAWVSDYRGENGLMVVDGSFPSAPEPGDDFVVQRPPG